MATTATDTPITAEQLRLAWRHVSRPGWPPTLEAALEHPAYAVALRGIARNLHRRGIDCAAAAVPPQMPLFDYLPPARAALNVGDALGHFAPAPIRNRFG